MSTRRELSVLLITGVPGIGKTTLIRRVVDGVRKRAHDINIQGFYTCERRDSATHERTGFDVCTLGNEKNTAPLARIAGAGRTGPMVGKYAVCVDDFERLAIECLRDASNCDLLVIDELGKMESLSKRFCDCVTSWIGNAMPHKRQVLLATIPVHKVGQRVLPIVEYISQRTMFPVLELTKSNRDAQVEHVCKQIVDALK